MRSWWKLFLILSPIGQKETCLDCFSILMPWGILYLKFGWNLMSLKASRTPSKIDDISRIHAGVDDDFHVPDWGWYPWWHYGWSTNSLRELYLKFSWNLMHLKASRTPSKIDDMSQIQLELMMILMFLTGVGVLGDDLDGLQIPWQSYV